MQKQKSFINTIVDLLITTMLIAILPTERDSAIYEDTIRLHILANSNSDNDQSVKLKIRDKILEKYSHLLKSDKSIVEAKSDIAGYLESIERDCQNWLSEMEISYGAKATLEDEWYDTRDYEDFSLPCGYYTSLKIELGCAEGKNWWCVMYPPICLDIATDNAKEYTDSEKALISKNGYNIKFKILEIVSKALK